MMGYPYDMGFPAALMPSTLTLPEASQVSVWLCGAGPGSNFDFATSSFHVPTNGSLCADASPAVVNIKNRIVRTVLSRFMRYPPCVHSPLIWLSVQCYG